MGGCLVTEGREGIFVFGLLDAAMGGKVSTCRTVVDEFVLFEEGQGARVIAGGEVDLCEPKGINRVVWLESEAVGAVENERGCGLIPTSQSQQLVSDEDGGVILMLVHGILPPVLEELLHGVLLAGCAFLVEFSTEGWTLRLRIERSK